MRRILVLLILLLIATAPTAHANLITNGSFESGSYIGGVPGFMTLQAMNSSITDWTISDGTVEWIDGYWLASNGTKSIDLNGNSLGAMSIANGFDTVAGAAYLLTFDLAGNPDGGPMVKTVEVSVGNMVASFGFDITGKTHTNMGWSRQSLYFTALADKTLLTFKSTTPDDRPYYGAAIDNVDVTAVPEPASMLLLGTGLAGIGRAWRKRRA